MIWSGILIYWANDVYRVGIGDWTLFHFFPQWFYQKFFIASRLAEGMAWHFAFMWIFFGNGLLYVLYNAFSGEWRFLLPNKNSLKESWQVVLHDLKIRKEPLPPRKYNGAQRIAYTGIILMGAGSLLTGLAIYKPIQFAWLTAILGGYGFARFIHFWLTIGYLAFFVVHVAQVVRAGWNNFRAMVTGYELVPADVPVPEGEAPIEVEPTEGGSCPPSHRRLRVGLTSVVVTLFLALAGTLAYAAAMEWSAR